jgi:hypothetical protein
MDRFEGAHALVTGASAGLGETFARQLADAGAKELILAARRTDRLERLAVELRARHPGSNIHVITADLGSAEGALALAAEVGKRGVVIDVLVNNAGLGDIGPFATAEWAKLYSVMMVNMTALTALTHAFLPGMVRNGSGRIIQVSSTAGFVPIPTFAVYAATKAYVCSFSEALRMELRGTGVTVTQLCPGPVKTEFGDVAARPDGKRKFAPPAFMLVSAEQVVRETLAAAAAGRARVVPGLFVRMCMLAAEAVPMPILRLVLGLTGNAVLRNQPPSSRHQKNEP